MRISVFIILLFSISIVFGQKKRKNKDVSSEMDVVALTDSDSLKAEMTLIEAEKQLILEEYEKSLELFLVVDELSPRSAAVNFKLADILTKMGNNDDALVYAQSAINYDPTNKYYYLLTAEILKATSNLAMAAKTYETMIAEVEGTETYRFDLAVLYRYMGKYEKALVSYNQVEEEFGVSEIIFREKEQIFNRTKNYDALILEWRKLIIAYPENFDFKIEFIELLLSQGKDDIVEQELISLESNERGRIASAMVRVRLALQKGERTQAIALAELPINASQVDLNDKILLINELIIEDLSEAQIESIKALCVAMTSIHPEEYVAQAYAGDVFFRLESPEEARNYYLSSVRINPSRFEVWQNILNIDGQLNDTEAIIGHAESALEYFPNQGLLYYFAGTGYLIAKNYRRATQVLEQGIKFTLDPALLTIMYGQLGDGYNSQKEFEKSYLSYEKALEQNPDNDHVLNNYSYFLSLRGQKLDKAVGMSSRLIELFPDNPTYLDTHGWVLYKLQRFDEAEQVLKKAVDLEEDGTVIEHYGDVLYKLGNIEDAVAQWKRASSLGDVSKDIQKKIDDKKLYE